VAHQFYDLLRNADREIHIIEDAPHFLTHTHYRQVCRCPLFYRISITLAIFFQVNPLIENFLDRVAGVDSKRAIYLSLPQTLELLPESNGTLSKKSSIFGMFGIKVQSRA